MFTAQYLPTGTTIWSPWFSRQGDYLRPTLEVVANGGSSPTITVKVYTKNTEDTTDGTNADSGTTITGTTAGTRYTAEWVPSPNASHGLDELVRYQFAVTGSSAWVLFRMLTPVWFNKV